MKIIKSAITSISVVIFAACCIAFLLFGISGTGWKALAIPTGSMRPGMPLGSLALVHNVPDSSLKIGDVITYTNPLNTKRTISHRIIKEYLVGNKVPTYVTKGDANKSADIPVTAGSIKGKVIWHVSYLGYGLLYAKQPIIILPIVYVAALLIMIEEVRRLNDYYKLSQPYKLYGYYFIKQSSSVFRKKLSYGVALTLAFVMISAAAGPTAFALLRSNTVVLANNRLSLKAVKPPPNKCSTSSNNNNINVNNSSSQSSSTGNATVSGNTNGGSATSGSASNTNTTTTSITVTNC